jgi:hypothetical protein
MAGPLSAFPPGLLSLFGIRTGGKNPSQLGDLLVPQVDLLEWYLAQQWQPQRTTIADIGAASGFQVIGSVSTVPQTQIWFVRNAYTGPNSVIGAGNNYSWMLAKNLIQPTIKTPLGVQVSATAGNTGRALALDSRPIILRPGESLGVQINGVTHAVAQDWEIGFEFIPLQA